jgi:hypothetical protein
MTKKMLSIFLSLFVVAMLALPMSAAHATKPTTMTLTGTYFITGPGDSYSSAAGKSDNYYMKTRNAPCLWTGDISGNSINHGNWLSKGGPILGGELAVTVMTFKFEDVTINDVGETGFVGTGDLTIGFSRSSEMERVHIKSGTGDLRSIRGEGTITKVNLITYNYEFEVQINP